MLTLEQLQSCMRTQNLRALTRELKISYYQLSQAKKGDRRLSSGALEKLSNYFEQ